MNVAATGPAGAGPQATGAADLETMPIDQALSRLEVTPDKGLSYEIVRQRLAQYGPNALPERQVSLAKKIVDHSTGPIAYMIEAAAVVSAFSAAGTTFSSSQACCCSTRAWNSGRT